MMWKKPNIVLIVVDALRARNLGLYGYHKDTSPNINEIARNGVIFENAFSCSNCTDPSFTSIMTGKHPISHGIIHHGVVPRDEVKEYYSRGNKNLAEILKLNGYTTMALSWLERWHKKGFDYYEYYGGVETTTLKRTVKNVLNKLPTTIRRSISDILMSIVYKANILDAKNITNHAMKLIKKNVDRQPFFLLIHYMDTHLPYNPGNKKEDDFFEETANNERIKDVLKRIKNPRWRKFLKKSLGNVKTTDEVIAKYDAAIAYVDENIGRLVEFIEKQGIKEDTIIVLTADHGESLTEHGVYFSHHCLYDETIHVPLVIQYANLPSRRISNLVQHVDILPTILDLLNIKINVETDGKSLIPLIEGNSEEDRLAIFAEEAGGYRKRAIRTNRWKYIQDVEGEPISGFESAKAPKRREICKYCGFKHMEAISLYDLNKDPKEYFNIAEDRPDITVIMRSILRDWEVSKKRKAEKQKITSKIIKFNL